MLTLCFWLLVKYLLNAKFYHFKEQVSDLNCGRSQKIFLEEMILKMNFEIKFYIPLYRTHFQAISVSFIEILKNFREKKKKTSHFTFEII